ncbi:MAG: endonuclease [Bacteroidales bacterium]|nr:endonuclease [Bacteroidales bacterium]
MKNLLFVFVTTSLFIFKLNISAQVPSGYYNGTENLTGDELKTALYNIIKGHTTFPYTASTTDVWDILKKTDRDTVDTTKVILLYTGWTRDAAKEYDNEAGWNREHVWAKSHGDFGTFEGPGTDVHALRPCDVSVNTARWNYDFAEGGEIYVDPDGTTECRRTSNSWEPRDEVKGDVARMIFYMATRYEGENGEPDLEIVDYVNSSPNYQPLHGKLSDLYKWHLQDTVSDWERRRNDIIYYDFQGNRNPYIDHPEFVDKIWGNLVANQKISSRLKTSVYPNPFKSFIKIEIDNQYTGKEIIVNLYNINGKKVINLKSTAAIIEIPLEFIENGAYILEIVYDKNIVQHELVVKN